MKKVLASVLVLLFLTAGAVGTASAKSHHPRHHHVKHHHKHHHHQHHHKG